MKKINKSGFTLIEIIVVLIIVGILAAIALPNFFSNVNKSKAQEAFAQFEPLKVAMETCLNQNINNENVCTAAKVAFTPVSANMTYAYTVPAAVASNGTGISAYGGAAPGTAVEVATLANGAVGDVITLKRQSAGVYSVSCGGAFNGVC